MNNTEQYLAKNYQQADRLMLCIVWGLFVMSLGLSSLHDTLKWSLIVGLPTALIVSTMVYLASGARITRQIVAASLMIFAALHIHQAAGMTELIQDPARAREMGLAGRRRAVDKFSWSRIAEETMAVYRSVL